MLAAALLDQEWHLRTEHDPQVAAEDVEAFEAEALERHGVRSALVPPRYRSGYFAHAFDGGYDAGYYSYLWSEVLDADMVDWFTDNGGLTRANGDTFRRDLLSRGGTVDPHGGVRGGARAGAEHRAADASPGARWLSAVAGAARRVLMAAVLMCSGLASCSQTKSYCSTLKADRKQLSTLSGPGRRQGRQGRGRGKALSRTDSLLSDLRDKAPDDIRDDWDTLVQALDGLDAAIKATGADPEDFEGGRRPAGVTEGQLRAVQQAAAELQATPVEQATQSIEQHAQDICKVDLSSELGSG